MKYRVLSFDLDGTLVDTLASLAEAGNRWLATLNYPPLPVLDYRFYVGNGAQKKLERLLAHYGHPAVTRNAETLDQAFMERELARYLDILEQVGYASLQAYPGLIDLLKQLQVNNCQLIVVTNKPQAVAEAVIKHVYTQAGVEFAAIIGGSKRYPLKPDPTSLLTYLDAHGYTCEQTAHIGDSNADMETAKRAGVTGIGVLWGFRDANELKEAGATYLVADSQALAKLLL